MLYNIFSPSASAGLSEWYILVDDTALWLSPDSEDHLRLRLSCLCKTFGPTGCTSSKYVDSPTTISGMLLNNQLWIHITHSLNTNKLPSKVIFAIFSYIMYRFRKLNNTKFNTNILLFIISWCLLSWSRCELSGIVFSIE